MKIEKHPIDQLFKEKLGNLEKDPPFGLLAQINQEMVSRGKVRRMNQLKTVLSIAASLILLLMAGWFTIDYNHQTDNEVAQQLIQKLPPVQQQLPVEETVSGKGETQIASNQHKNDLAVSPVQVASASKPSGRKNVAAPENKTTVNSLTNVASNDAVVASVDSPVTGQSKESPSTDKKSDDAFKKNTSPFRMQDLPKSNDYYSSNAGASPAAKKSGSSLNLWSLKAEVSETFTAMLQSGSSSSGEETRSMATMGGGMVASYKVSDKVTISSGIRFSQMKQGSHSSYALNQTSGITYLQPVEKSASITRDVSLYLPAPSSIVYSNGMKTSASNTFVSDLSQEFKYLEIPIQASYKILEGKQLSVGVTGGISTNFLVGNYASITENGIKLSSGNTDNLRNVLYSGSAGLELGYDLGNNLSLTIEPRIKQFMHSVSSNELVNIKPMQLGIFTGITYSFK
jgi:hypothetical protein